MVGVIFQRGHFSTCQTRKKSTPVTFFLHMRHVFLRPGVISLRRKMTPRSIFDGDRYSSLHQKSEFCEYITSLHIQHSIYVRQFEFFVFTMKQIASIFCNVSFSRQYKYSMFSLRLAIYTWITCRPRIEIDLYDCPIVFREDITMLHNKQKGSLTCAGTITSVDVRRLCLWIYIKEMLTEVPHIVQHYIWEYKHSRYLLMN